MQGLGQIESGTRMCSYPWEEHILVISPPYILLAKASSHLAALPEADDLFPVCCIGNIHGPTTAMLCHLLIKSLTER